ncbi:MAG: hypothetical protein Q9182_001351 [Xanthomendoza sp. 2 TL-2023]
MDSVRSHTADEIIQMMKKTPLFMTHLEEEAPTADDKEEEEDNHNIHLEALRALQYEGTRAEVALGFKERGNEMVAEKRWKDAREFYTRGIVTLTTQPPPPANNERITDDDDAEMAKEKAIAEACYLNRALCNLELKNYRATLTDTSHTPTNPKAHYRASLALAALARYPEALAAIARGRCLTPDSSPEQHLAFQTLETRIANQKFAFDVAETQRRERRERKRDEERVLAAAIAERGIRIRSTKEEVDLEDAVMRVVPDALGLAGSGSGSELWFPVLVVYPLVGRTDFVKGVGEGERVGGVLEVVLKGGVGWDDDGGEYVIGGVKVFMETVGGGVVKVGGKVRWGDVLKGGKVEVVDGVVRIFVVPGGRVGEWVEGMKKGRKGGGRLG